MRKSRSHRDSECRKYGRALRVLAILFGLLPAMAAAQAVITQQLSGGGTVTVTPRDTAATPHLSINVAPFATWQPEGFEAPLEIRADANYLAFIDAWRLAIYRAGDTDRRNPLRVFDGQGASLPAQLSWDGRIDQGPRLRPGETLHAVLSVRDVAGNMDHSAPASVLVARYLMDRERAGYDKERASRSAAFDAGAPPNERAIPLAGHAVELAVEGWEGADRAAFSALPVALTKGRGRRAQILPPGRYSLAIQRVTGEGEALAFQPRAALELTLPPLFSAPLAVKGTGTLERLAAVAPPLPVEGLAHDGAVSGSSALTLMPVEEGARALAALARIDPEAPVHLFRDARKRRVIRVSPDQDAALWAGPGAPRDGAPPLSDPETLTVRVRFPAEAVTELVLPHTDIVPGSLRIDMTMNDVPLRGLAPGRDYFTDFSEGRVRLTRNAAREIAPAVETANNFGKEARMRVSYSILRLPEAMAQGGSGRDFDVAGTGDRFLHSNAGAAGVLETVLTGGKPRPEGVFGWVASLWDRLF